MSLEESNENKVGSVRVLAVNKPADKPKQMPLYRPIKVKEIHQGNLHILSERRQMWLMVSRWLLTVCATIPILMPEWRYYAWAVFIPGSLLSLLVWDYVSHIRHLKSRQFELRKLIIVEDEYERLMVLRRPDKVDYLSPYLVYFLVSLLIVAGATALTKYRSIYGPTNVFETVLDERSKPQSKATTKVIVGS